MTTAIESKQDATKQSQKEQLETFSCMLDIGEVMLAAGADVDTVEDILVKMGKAYGAYKMDVLVITELIIATATMPGHNEHTLSRRILNEGSTNFDRLEALTDLCKSYCQSPIPADDLRKSLQRIKGKPFPKVSLYLGGALAAGGFAIFFGGSLVDGLVSAFFALGVCFCIKHFQKLTPNVIHFRHSYLPSLEAHSCDQYRHGHHRRDHAPYSWRSDDQCNTRHALRGNDIGRHALHREPLSRYLARAGIHGRTLAG